MIATVFWADLRRGSRNGRAFYLRWAFGGLVAVQVLWAAGQYYDALHWAGKQGRSTTNVAATSAGELTSLLVYQHFILVGLLTPGFVAGAVADEKTTGTLQYLLATHLTPLSLVIGKMAARVTQVLVLALASVPVLALTGAFGGLSESSLPTILVTTAALVGGLGGVSMLASVWAKHTRSAMLLVYGGAVLFSIASAFDTVAAPALARWLNSPSGFSLAECFNPFYVLEASLATDDKRDQLPFRLGLFVAAWAVAGGLGTVLAVLRLRPAYIRQLEARPAGGRRLARFRARPAVYDPPLTWKETYVGLPVPLWLGLLLAGVLSGGLQLAGHLFGGSRPLPITPQEATDVLAPALSIGGFVLTLLMGVRAASSISGEREKNTWGELLTTPMTAEELVKGKLMGILASVWPFYAVHIAATVVVCALVVGRPWEVVALMAVAGGLATAGLLRIGARRVPAWCALPVLAAIPTTPAVVVFVLAAVAAGWLASQFIGAVGLWASAGSASSWVSLVKTLAIGYAGASLLYCVAAPVFCIFFCLFSVIAAATQSMGQQFGGSGADIAGVVVVILGVLFYAGLYYAVSLWMVGLAQERIAQKDRIPAGRIRRMPMTRRKSVTTEYTEHTEGRER